MPRRSAIPFFAGLAAGLVLAAGASLYRRRPLARVPCPEGLADPAVAGVSSRLTEMPQVRALPWLAVRRALHLCDTGRAADLGCGAGQFAVALARRAPQLHVTGVDLSNVLLAQALRRAAEAGLAHRVDFRTGDVGATPFPTGSLDLVVSALSLHRWRDPVGVLNEVARVLRPGGAFLIFDLRRDMSAPFYIATLLLGKPGFSEKPGFSSRQELLSSRNAAYTPDEAAALAQASQLTGWRVARGPFWLSIEGKTVLR